MDTPRPERLTHDLAQAMLPAGLEPHGMTVIDAALALTPWLGERLAAAEAEAVDLRRQLAITKLREFQLQLDADSSRDLTAEIVAWESAVAEEEATWTDERGPYPEPEGAEKLDQIQAEVEEWTKRFRPTPEAAADPLADALSVAEEAGEVCRAVLKRAHGKRPGTDWSAQLRDEAGDVVIDERVEQRRRQPRAVHAGRRDHLAQRIVD